MYSENTDKIYIYHVKSTKFQFTLLNILKFCKMKSTEICNKTANIHTAVYP